MITDLNRNISLQYQQELRTLQTIREVALKQEWAPSEDQLLNRIDAAVDLCLQQINIHEREVSN